MLLAPALTDPLALIPWFITLVIGIPGGALIVKAIFFMADAHRDLKTVVNYVHDRRSIDAHDELMFEFFKNDINVLQDSVKINRRDWPDRRSGADRRAS
jgi:hypothetical protein